MFIKLSDYLRPVDSIGKEYRGTVVNNVDPEEIGRIQVNIPGFIVGTQAADGSWNLPWTYQKSPSMLGGSTDSSSFAVPEIGNEVFVEFPYNDIYAGFYSFYWQSSETHQDFLNEDYPASYGFRDTTGTSLQINKAKLFLEFIHASGARFYIDNTSAITAQSSTSITFVSEDGKTSFVFDLSTGDVNFGSKNSYTCSAPTINNTTDQQNDNIGQHSDTVTGGRTTQIYGGLSTSVGGDIGEAALGNRASTIAGDKSELVAGTTSETWGQGKSETSVAGNIATTIEEGNRQTSLTLGNWVADLVAGNFQVSITAGNFSVSTDAGSLTLENDIGSIEIDDTGDITAENELATAELSAEGDVKLSNTATGEFHINPAGLIALGNSSAELLDLLSTLIESFEENAEAFVIGCVPGGPGTLNPAVVSAVVEFLVQLALIMGTL